MLEAILIDVGGPLVDEDGFFRRADQLILSELAAAGRAIMPEEYERILISYTKRCFPNPREVTLWHLLRPDLAEFKRVRELLRQLVRDWAASAVRPGAAAAVAALARGKGYKLALAGNQQAKVKELLQKEGILEHFTFRLVSEEMGVTKPDPVFFQIILDSLGAEPKEAVMVGDRLDYDIFPAKLIGLRTVRVLVGPYAAQEPLTSAYEPELTIPSLGELPEAMGRLEPAQ
jgi:HAD superfamily hydrolase (TIGR01549 family)